MEAVKNVFFSNSTWVSAWMDQTRIIKKFDVITQRRFYRSEPHETGSGELKLKL